MSCKSNNIYRPARRFLTKSRDEIKDVKTFFYHFEDPAEEKLFRTFMPGQFAMVSMYSVPARSRFRCLPVPPKTNCSLPTRKVGSVTAAMHELKPGDRFAIRGPYGNGFPMKQYEGRNLIVVAGGIGLIPLRLGHHLRPAPSREIWQDPGLLRLPNPQRPHVHEKLQEWQGDRGFECYLTVDRAEGDWKGNVGVVGSLFKKPGVEMPLENTTVFVCGPPIMFRFVLADLQKMGYQDENMVSTLERYMKCGVGKCGHCCIGVAYVCTDGPVFRLEQIRKLGEVI